LKTLCTFHGLFPVSLGDLAGHFFKRDLKQTTANLEKTFIFTVSTKVKS